MKERTKELQMAKEKAEESDRLKTSFLANMSHEIRTPLNAIVGFSELLANDDADESFKKTALEQINKSNNMLLRLIDDVIDLSKIRAAKISIKKTKFDLYTLLNELYITFKHRLKERRDNAVKLIFNKEYDSIGVYSDYERLKQVLSNFLSNANKIYRKWNDRAGVQNRQ